MRSVGLDRVHEGEVVSWWGACLPVFYPRWRSWSVTGIFAGSMAQLVRGAGTAGAVFRGDWRQHWERRTLTRRSSAGVSSLSIKAIARKVVALFLDVSGGRR